MSRQQQYTGVLVAAVCLVMSGCSGSSMNAQRHATTIPLEPVSVSAASRNLVWLLAGRSCPRGSCHLALLRSTDGGRSWRHELLPRAVRVGRPSAIEFADAHNGWLFGRRLWATHDDGHTWRAVRVPGSVQGLQVTDGSVFVLVGRCSANHGCRSFKLLRGSIPTSQLSKQRLPLSLSHDDATASLGTHGLSVAVLTNAMPSPRNDTDKLEVSTDGGRTWSVRTGPCFNELGGRIAPVGNVIWAACPSGMLAQVMRSTGGPFSGNLGGPNSESVTPTGTDSAVASLIGLRTYWTADGGVKWRRSRLPRLPRDGWFEDMSFADAVHGYALYEATHTTTLLATTDGGRRWTKVAPPTLP